MRSLSSILRASEALALVLIALGCVLFQLQLPRHFASASDDRQLTAYLEQNARTGDALVLQPWWTERARLVAPTSLPVVGYLGVTDDDLDAYPRLWVLAQPDLPRSDMAGFWRSFSNRRRSAQPPTRIGPYELSLYENNRHRPRSFDAVARLSDARVWNDEAGTVSDCPPQGAAFRCPSGNLVAAEWHEILFAPRRCIRFFPPRNGGVMSVEWANVSAAGGVELSGGLIADRGVPRGASLTPVELWLAVNGERRASLTFNPGEEGRKKIAAPEGILGATLRVSVRANNPELRELCFELVGYDN